MEHFNIHSRKPGFAVCTAMAAALLVGCSGHGPLASTGTPAVSNEGDMALSRSDAQIAKAEKRVAKSPRNASVRADLAQVYLSAGRFDSAATTFQDAISLGEDSPRVGLGLVLAYVGSGRNAQALATLDRWHARIPAGDFGLALALAGRPAQAVDLLSDALRSGDDNPKMRQNLAYAYALDGRWAEARVVASQDVPADQIDARMSEWASRARPEQYQARVAGLLGVPMRADAGQPAALALNGNADEPRMAMADKPAPLPVPARELPPVGAERRIEPAEKAEPAMAQVAEAEPMTFPQAFATSAPAPAAQKQSVKFVSQPAVKPLGQARSAYVEAPAASTHLVQLGSFRTLEGAKRAWGIFVARNPALKDHTMRITEADVRGQHYFRVAAEGFDRGSARTLCSNVRDGGHGCFAYAETRTLPGALPGKVHTGPLLASR